MATFGTDKSPSKKSDEPSINSSNTLSTRKISIRKPDDVKNAFTEILSDKVDLQGASPIPNEKMTREGVLKKVTTFQAMTSLCEITESERTIKVIGSKAQVYLTAEILAAAGKNNRGKQTWKLIFDLELSDSWRITGIRGNSQGELMIQ